MPALPVHLLGRAYVGNFQTNSPFAHGLLACASARLRLHFGTLDWFLSLLRLSVLRTSTCVRFVPACRVEQNSSKRGARTALVAALPSPNFSSTKVPGGLNASDVARCRMLSCADNA